MNRRVVVLALAAVAHLLSPEGHAASIFPATEAEEEGAPLETLDAGWRLFVQKGDLEGAGARFGEAAKQAPDHPLVLFAQAAVATEEGRYREAFEACVQALQGPAWGPWTEVLLVDSVELLRYVEEPAPLVAALSERLAREDLSWMQAALLRRALAGVYVRLGRTSDARALLEQDAWVREWLVIGPFSNRDRAGFGQAWGPEEGLPKLDPGETYPGRGRPVGWFRARSRWDGRLDLSAVLHPGTETLAYAATLVKAPADTDATLVLGAAGAVAVWVNGEPVFQDATYRAGLHPCQTLLAVTLREGWNQIVLKAAAERDGASRLCMRVLPATPEALVRSGSAAVLAEPLPLSVDEADLAAYEPPAAAPGHIKAGEAAEGEAETEADGEGDAEGDQEEDQEGEESADGEADGEQGGQPEAAAAGQDGRKADQPPAPPRSWGALGFFDQELANRPYNALALVSKAYLQIHYGLDDPRWMRTRPLLAKAARAWPRFPLAQELASVVQPGENEARQFLERAAASSERAVAARELLLEHLQRGGFLRQAEEGARALLEQHPSAAAWRVLGKVEASRGWRPEAHAAFQKALARAPRWSALYMDLADTAPGETETLASLRRGEEQAPSAALRKRLADRLLRRHAFEQAAAALRAALDVDPFDAEAWAALADTERACGKLDAAMEAVDASLEWLPQSPVLLEKLGRLSLQAGQQSRGVGLLRQALRVKADNPALAEYLKQFEPERTRFYAAHDIAFETLSGKEKGPEDHPRHNKVVLLDQGFVRVNPNGTKSMMIHWVAKVLRRGAVREEARHSIPYDPERQRVEVVRARVVQPDGSVIENPRIHDRTYGQGRGPQAVYTGSYRIKTVEFPQVKEGSIVDFQYTVEDTRENLYGDEFEDAFFIGSTDPTIRFEYAADVPKEMELRTGQAGTDLEPVESAPAEDRRLLVWKARDLPGLEIEPRMPPRSELIPALRLSTFPDWDAVARSVWNLSKEQFVLPEDIRKEVAALTRECETREEKIAAIYHFVTSKIRYVSISYGRFGYKPHKAERTYRAGYGDCKDTAVLFCAMLQTVGIEARFALVRTWGRGKERTGVPGRGLFDHAIAYVPPSGPGGKHYWLDGTTDYFPFGELPSMDRDTIALVVGPDGGERIEIDSDRAEYNTTVQRVQLRLDPAGGGTVALRESVTGAFATGWFMPGFRRLLEAPARLKTVLERLVAQRQPGATLEDLAYGGKAIQDPACWIAFGLTSDTLLQKEGQVFKCPCVFFRPLAVPLKLSEVFATQRERTHDLMLGIPWTRTVAMELVLPEGAVLRSLPEDLTLEHPFGVFRRSSAKTEQGARLEITLALTVRRLAVDDYPAFKAFCNLVDSAEGERVIYQLHEAPAAEDPAGETDGAGQADPAREAETHAEEEDNDEEKDNDEEAAEHEAEQQDEEKAARDAPGGEGTGPAP